MELQVHIYVPIFKANRFLGRSNGKRMVFSTNGKTTTTSTCKSMKFNPYFTQYTKLTQSGSNTLSRKHRYTFFMNLDLISLNHVSPTGTLIQDLSTSHNKTLPFLNSQVIFRLAW